MPTNETIEAFPIFDPDTAADRPAHSAAIGATVAAVGAPDALGGAGALAIYTYSEALNAWGFVGVMSGSRIGGSEQVRGFGAACLAVGDTLIVGAHGDDETPGRVLVLKPSYGAWSFGSVATITALSRPDSAKGDRFGAALGHCRLDGTDFVVVGAPNAAPPIGASGPGQVFIFRGLGSGGPWSTSNIPNPSADGAADDRFGSAVAIGAVPVEEAPSLVLAVGAPGAGQGAVYVAAIPDPVTWGGRLQFDAPIVPSFPDADEDFQTSEFGSAVSLAGGVLAVGAPADPNFTEEIEGTGAVWIYDYHDGAFVAGENLYGPTADGAFGTALALSLDGSSGSLAVGVPGAGAGEAHTFLVERDADGQVSMTPNGQFAPLPGKPGDRFGCAVSLSDSALGPWLFVGAPGNPKGGQDGGGYLFVTGEKKPTWLDVPDTPSLPVRWAGQPLDPFKKYSPQIPRYLR